MKRIFCLVIVFFMSIALVRFANNSNETLRVSTFLDRLSNLHISFTETVELLIEAENELEFPSLKNYRPGDLIEWLVEFLIYFTKFPIAIIKDLITFVKSCYAFFVALTGFTAPN